MPAGSLTGDLSSGVTAVAAGYHHSLAVRNGNVYAWGENALEALGDRDGVEFDDSMQIDSTDLHNIIAVAAGQYNSYALSSDGSLWVWGDNTEAALGLGTLQQDYLTPQHLLPPSGYSFRSIDVDASANYFALATLAAVPEPTSVVLMVLALPGLAFAAAVRRCGNSICPRFLSVF